MQIWSIMALVVTLLFSSVTFTSYSEREIYEITQIHHIQFTSISDVKWSPDGSRLAIVEPPSIHILDTETWETILTIHDASASIQWSPDGTRLAGVRGGRNESLLIWDADTGELLEHFYQHEEDISFGIYFLSRLSWSPDGTRISSDSAGINMYLWDVEDGDTIVVEGHEENGVTETDWSPDSTRIVSGGADGTVRIWDASTGEQLLSITGFGMFVDWHPTGEQIVVSGAYENASHFASVLDVFSGEELLRVEHGEPILSVRWSHDGTLFATGGLAGFVNVWGGQRGTSIATLENHIGEIITMLDWHPNKNFLASADLDGLLVVTRFE